MTMPPDFTAEQAIAVQRSLREQLGLAPERFPLPALIGMISDEIEQWRAAGRDDAAIARIIADHTGHTISPEEVGRHYATPEQRRPG